jgi:hypothetical protein
MSEQKETSELKDKYLKLIAPFPADSIHWRVGSTTKDGSKGMALAYIDARDVMNRLDRTVGPHNWSDDYKEVMGRIVCNLSVRLDGEWVTKADGAGDTDFEGEKGGLSDAFKRAAVKFGIGRYLYDLPAVWCPVEMRGKTAIITTPPKLPAWALPPAVKAPE